MKTKLAKLHRRQLRCKPLMENLEDLNIAKGKQSYHDRMDPSTCHGCWKKLSILEPGHCKAGCKEFATTNEERDCRKSYWGSKAVKRYKECKKECKVTSNDEMKREGQAKISC